MTKEEFGTAVKGVIDKSVLYTRASVVIYVVTAAAVLAARGIVSGDAVIGLLGMALGFSLNTSDRKRGTDEGRNGVG